MKEAEEWKDITDYEGLYQVNNLGRVKNIKKNTFLKEHKYKTGYLYYVLCKNGKVKNIRMHRLIAEHFIPNPLNKRDVNHIDGNKENNDINNLEWVTRSENIKHAFINGLNYISDKHRMIASKIGAINGKKYSSIPVAQYDKNGNFIKVWNSIMDVERKLNINNGNISSCCNGNRKSAGGYIWKFQNVKKD